MFDEEQLRRARDRIAALLALADPDNGGTPAECASAARMAERVAERFGIDLDTMSATWQDAHGEVIDGVLVRKPAEHRLWSSRLLWRLAYVLDVDTGWHPDGEVLTGARDDVELLVRAHRDAMAAITAAHDQAIAGLLDAAARAARRYVDARYPDPRYHHDAIGQLRYWNEERLIAEIIETLPSMAPRTARAAARALRAGRVAAIDATPASLERSLWEGAIDRIVQRMEDLDEIRKPGRVLREQPAGTEDAREQPAGTEDSTTAVGRPAPRRRTRAPPPWSDDAAAAGAAAAAAAAIGLHDVVA